jgi:AraC-like DNA-binding protein
MTDPLSEVVQLLRPRAVFSKAICGAGRWGVRYSRFGQPGFCAVIEGRCRLAVDGEGPITLEEGDFVLLSATPAFTMSGFEPVTPKLLDPHAAVPATDEIRHGRPDGPPDVRLFGGYFAFGSPDTALLVSLLPAMIHIRGVSRLTMLVRLLGEEAGRRDIGRDFILARLVEILLIEALRAAPAGDLAPGLLRGLADQRISHALRQMHRNVERAWTVSELARETGMSRSAFFDRFALSVGIRPMEYLLGWRMAMAKDLLRGGNIALDEVARRIGYGSASTFSTAFSRHVGQSPGRFMRASGTTEQTLRSAS